MTEQEDVRPPAPHGASPDGPVGGANGPFDFRLGSHDIKEAALDLVRQHPVPSLLLAATAGFLIGRYRGKAIGAALAGLATRAALKQLQAVFDQSEI
ncbi:MAG: hypothetical protein IT186_19895 [Acidobacteria bacterium]|nr:hypothetical protein [Acidobacteriota bacterium]MCG3191397.1 hypothetical protein [Thermoanaerobaculia bacterium]MCK6680935.1 hypothetical protein [Thermoanaerobaculia bacterium]